MASVTNMDPSDFEGRAYGPLSWRVAADNVADFVEVTGDDLERWNSVCPPGFASSALFSVAPDLLAELYDRSVIHGEQTFTWHAPIAVGSLLQVSGSVTRVRERGGVFFITFEMRADDGDAAKVSGKSLFLVSGESLAAGLPEFERLEPPHSYRGEPGVGETSASRADLVRYAAATRDWNPVHWDHDAARAAGFPGVVVHGLLQAGWALRAAYSGEDTTHPFAAGRFRFRNPLLPARPVGLSVTNEGRIIEVVLADDETQYLTATITRSDE